MSAPPDESRRWRARWPARHNLLGSMTAAVVLLAVEGGYGIVALAPLGPAFVQHAFVIAIFCAVIGNLVAAAAGVRGLHVGGASAALALLVPPFLLALMADPRLRLPDGQPDAGLLLGFLATGIMLAGALQWLAGRLRLGKLMRFVPYPVHAGFMNGVAILVVLAMLPDVLGLPRGETLATWPQARPGALLVAGLTAFVAMRPPAWTRALPPFLAALLCGTAAHHALAAGFGPQLLGPLLGAVQVEWPDPGAVAPLLRAVRSGLVFDHTGLMLQFAAVLMVTASVQTLMAASLTDGLTDERHDGERLLRANGLANLVNGLLGLLPFAHSASRAAVSHHAGCRGPWAGPGFSLCLLGALVLGLGVLRYLPMSVIAGSFLAVSWGLVDGWSRHATLDLLRQARRGQRPAGSLAASFAVMSLVALTSVFVSLAVGVAVGMAVAILMFLRSNIRSPVRSITGAQLQGSRKLRPAAQAALLKAQGRRIAVVALDGALFFGTADAAARAIDRVAMETDQIIIDFQRVSEVDASGARVLLQAVARLRRAGKRLLLASLDGAGDARLQAIRAMDPSHLLSDADLFPDADRALEQAEEVLLAQLAPGGAEAAELTLAQTQFSAGLSDTDIATLGGLLQRQAVAAGERVFRQGDPGDALYVVLGGQIGICVPGRRLVSFAPGVVFGEIGLLRDSPRTADALAETDAVLLKLSRADYARLGAEHPRLLGQLLLNLSLHLSARLGALTDELQAASGQR